MSVKQAILDFTDGEIRTRIFVAPDRVLCEPVALPIKHRDGPKRACGRPVRIFQFICKKFCADVARDGPATLGPTPGGVGRDLNRESKRFTGMACDLSAWPAKDLTRDHHAWARL